MPSYGSLNSPSIRKMENGHGYGGSSRTSFDISRIIGDPFALATISISILAWMIAFISSVIASVRGGYPNYSWWSLVFMFFVILGVLITVAFDAEHTYHVAIVGFLGAGLVFTTSSVNSLVYSADGAFEAAGAGFILLSMVNIVWIFYYGSQPQARHRTFVDSFALHKDRHSSRASRQPSNNYRPDTSVTNAPPQMYTSAQLNGFETSSPVSGFPGGPVGADRRNSSQPRFGAGLNSNSQGPTPPEGPNDGEATGPVEYPYRAKAIYSYEANPDDANEISFQKHDILEVSDVSGRWWQARKPNGETGIAPSNYLILL